MFVLLLKESQYFEISIYIVHYFVKLQLLRFRALQATEGVVEWFRLQSVQHMGRSITTALSEWGHERPEKKELFKYVQMRKLGHQGFDSSPTYPHHNIAKFNPILCEVFWLGPNAPTEQSISMKQIATCFVSMRWSMQKYSDFAKWRKINIHPLQLFQKVKLSIAMYSSIRRNVLHQINTHLHMYTKVLTCVCIYIYIYSTWKC